jgi:diaminohydroxyphosphoribosylaminopyrimidine deaminase/5-amino-6-(5-phosphoribosylamino)uracil reductase
MGLPDRPRILVTGETARAEANRLRAGFDAILVGVGTVLADDPLLTVRTQSVRVPSRRVVLDSDARLPLSSRLLTDPAPVLVLTAPDASPERVAALQEAGVQVRRVARRGEGGMDASGVVAALAEEGIRSVFCEGGVRVARTLLGADLVERQYLFMAAGRLGAQGLRPLEGLPATTPGGWSVARSRRVGADALLVLERERSEDVHGDR